MRTLRIDGKMQMVFVLKETDESIVYITVKSLSRVDYERLLDIEKQGGEMLAEMRKTKLANGRNALALYDNLIQVMKFSGNGQGVRIRKPDEPQAIGQNIDSTPKQEQESAPVVEQQEEKQQPKRRGRPPKKQQAEQ